MEFREEEFLQLSGIQHFLFCRRQWALIHIEHQWKENVRTVEGELLHEKVHDPEFHEKRKNILKIGALRIHSRNLGISGECDLVEFYKDENGVSIQLQEGLWTPYPVEYKRGHSKINDADRAQLCAQSMCMEEMFCCNIQKGALYYSETRHREEVEFTEALREVVKNAVSEMHNLYVKGYTPKVKISKSCKACSLSEYCMDCLDVKVPVEDYMRSYLGDGE